MNLQENIKRIKEVMGVLNEQQKDPMIMLTDLENNINTLLGYYVKTEDGKFFDINDTEMKNPVDMTPTGEYLKAKVESIIYGAQKQNKYTNELKQIKEKIINGKYKEFFGDWDSITVPQQKFDFYSGTKCTTPNKNPGCGRLT